MFREMSQMAGMLRQLPKIKEEMEKFQLRIGQITAEGDAGGGMVKVRVNGKMEVLGCALSDDVLKNPDREFLEDLIKAAVNQAIERVRERIGEETAKMTAELGLPSGVGLPGVG